MMTTKDNGSVSVGFGGAKVGFGWADNSLTCDSEGNCMLKDDLIKIGGSIGGVSASMKFWADNSLICDADDSRFFLLSKFI